MQRRLLSGRQTFATATGCTIRLHRPDGVVLATFDGHTDRVRSIAFDPTGRRLVSCGADAQGYVWFVL